MFMTMRMLSPSTLFAMLLSLMLLHQVSAAPVTTHPRMSIEKRVNNVQEACMDWDGRTFSVKYEYNDDGSMKSATTKCKGGACNGQTCTFTPTTTD